MIRRARSTVGAIRLITSSALPFAILTASRCENRIRRFAPAALYNLRSSREIPSSPGATNALTWSVCGSRPASANTFLSASISLLKVCGLPAMGAVLRSAWASARGRNFLVAGIKCLATGAVLAVLLAFIPRWDFRSSPWIGGLCVVAGLLVLAGLALLGARSSGR